MDYKIIIAKSVYTDYDNIAQHFAEYSSTQKLKKLLQAIETAILKLPQNPKMYQIQTESYYQIRKIRKMLVDDYAIFYYVDETNFEIHIGRIRNQKQDNRKLKFE